MYEKIFNNLSPHGCVRNFYLLQSRYSKMGNKNMKKNTIIVFRNRAFSQKELQQMKQIIQIHWNRGRTYISKIICQHLNWIQPNGQLKDQVCRLLLLKLEKEGYIELPPRKKSANNYRRAYYRNRTEVLNKISIQPITGSVEQIKPIELRQVRKTSDEFLWNELVYKYHYLSYRIIVGSHLKYIAFYKGRPLACLAWGAAIWALQCRDQFIGWTHNQRKKNLKFVVNQTRYLILPWINVKNLASHLLSINIKRLLVDWIQIYAQPIYLLETFVDRSKFCGTCYMASNWIYVGQTKGYSKQINFYYHGKVKDIYLYPLDPKFREKLEIT